MTLIEGLDSTTIRVIEAQCILSAMKDHGELFTLRIMKPEVMQ